MGAPLIVSAVYDAPDDQWTLTWDSDVSGFDFSGTIWVIDGNNAAFISQLSPTVQRWENPAGVIGGPGLVWHLGPGTPPGIDEQDGVTT